eukprot:s330_g1.t1
MSMDLVGRLIFKVMKPLKSGQDKPQPPKSDTRSEQILLKDAKPKQPLQANSARRGPLKAQASKLPPSTPSGLAECHTTAAYMSVTG